MHVGKRERYNNGIDMQREREREREKEKRKERLTHPLTIVNIERMFLMYVLLVFLY
jgi:hypothetical protein